MKEITFLFFVILFAITSSAQEASRFKFDYTIPSKVFKEERKISVYLPPSYYKYPESKFTVTYVLDGQFEPFINLTAKTLEYNSYMYKYTPTIVVGIHSKNRSREFSAPIPGNKRDEDYKGGRAPELQQHFKDEVFSLVDSIYNERILPFRSILGHSSGGAFILYNLFSEEKDLFDAYLAISPAIRAKSAYILDIAASRLKKGEKFLKFLYCSSGTVGEREELFGGAVHRLDSIFKVYPANGLIWSKSKFEGMGHWTCVPPSLNAGMVALTRAFRVDEKMYFDFANNEQLTMREQIDSFYKKRKEEYNFFEIPSGGYLSRVAEELVKKNKNQDALDICEWALVHYPLHYTLTKFRARLLLEMGNKEAAYIAFNESLEALEKVKEKMSAENYEEHKMNLKEKLEACTQ